ncbi:CtsR family transcriptional regulator [Enterococcus nangangensis]|uniref:CtsR family transcriptional regulator n=1 Tax=Enterococcus nangangensis TaxID=2559926 RepID=UPI0010F9E676|nr:CtsR family transcriptional regulator [Enterococcus nangangensis]
MSNRNTSDLIEAYLKKILAGNDQVEIRRSEMAELFQCVPSQINYVINTRFTTQQGYQVESKRGGGGYIRIVKLRFSDQRSYLKQLKRAVGKMMTAKEAQLLLQQLYEEQLITKREGNLFLATLSPQVLGIFQEENYLRAHLMQAFLERLSYEDEE